MKEEEVILELVTSIREDVGAITNFKNCVVVSQLPKTRSGKILRKVLRVSTMLMIE